MRPSPAPAGATAAALVLGLLLALTGPAALAAAPALAVPVEVLLPDAPGLDGPVRLAPPLAAALGTDVLAPAASTRPEAGGRPAPATEPEPGATRLWPVTDFRADVPVVSLRPFVLRAFGSSAEVWVAGGPEGTSFAPGDCRNARRDDVDVSDAQAKALVREFDTAIHPRETKAFSDPVERDGTRTVPGIAAAGLDFSGSGKRTVILVDNIRDSGYDKVGEPGVSGFYTPTYSTLTDRNVVTVDSFDWRHRTGANPPDDSTSELCTNRTAMPRYVESTIAHEWYHLLANDRDYLEPLWVDEGLAEYAMSVVGYPKTRRTITQPGAERELICFQGFGTTRGPSNAHPVACGGPQNSLTVWSDEGGGHELLADYGNAWSFMLFLADRYGPAFMRGLHRDRGVQGLPGVAVTLREHGGGGTSIAQLLHDFRLMNLLDRFGEAKGARVTGIERERVSNPSLSAALDLANPASYAAPGVAPNGADYVRIGPGAKLRSLSFAGGKTQIDTTDEALDELVGPAGLPVGFVRVNGAWQLTLVGIDRAKARAAVVSFGPGSAHTLDRAKLAPLAAYPEVVAIVGFDRVADTDDEAGHYTLTVNGTVLEGG